MADPSLHFEANETVGISCCSILYNNRKGVCFLCVGEHLVTSELHECQVIQAAVFSVHNLNHCYIFVHTYKNILTLW